MTKKPAWPESIHELISNLETPLREACFIAELLAHMLEDLRPQDPLPETGYWLIYEMATRAEAAREAWRQAVEQEP